MYEAVHAHPEGSATVARHALTAARHGYDGIVVRTGVDGEAVAGIGVGSDGESDVTSDGEVAAASDGEVAASDAPAVTDEYGVDVVNAVEIDADDPGSAGGAVGDCRPDHALLCVVGGDDAINRFAVEEPRVDVLTRPMRGSGDVNHVLAKAARDNGVHVEFDLGPVLRETGGRRVRALSDLRKLREILDHYDAPHVVSANAASHLELRAPRELVAVAETAGFDPEWVREGLRAWGEIAARNRERLSEGFIAPGIRRGRYDERR